MTPSPEPPSHGDGRPPRAARAVRLYEAALRLVPPPARRDARAAAEILARQLAEATGRREAFGHLVRAWARLPGVVLAEWIEHVARRGGRGGGDGDVDIGRDLRYALRTLRRTPGFTASAALLLALGIGAVTAIFTLVDHVLLRPLPYPAPDRIVYFENASHPGGLFRRIQSFQTLDGAAAAMVEQVVLVGSGEPVRLDQARVSSGFFAFFGARAVHGRLLTADDERAPDVVVLDGGLWLRMFGGDRDVVGRTLDVDGETVTVVGVLDPAFSSPRALARGDGVDLWRPLDWSGEELDNEAYSVLRIAGRRVVGTPLEAVQEEMTALVAGLTSLHSRYREEDGSPTFFPVVPLAETTVRGVRRGLELVFGAVGLLLLVACLNVAHLFMARALGRAREMAVRRAMGAPTGTLMRQLLAESLVVGVVGAALGAALAHVSVRLYVAAAPSALPGAEGAAVDGRVLLFVAGVSVLTAVLFGMVPALRSLRGNAGDELRGTDRSRSEGPATAGLRSTLVVGEVAISLVLVAAAGLMLRSFVTVRAQDPGFDTAEVWSVPMRLNEVETPEEYRRTLDGMVAEALRIPGVERAAYTQVAPLEMTDGGTCCWGDRVDSEVGDPVRTLFSPVSEDYFATLGVELVHGATWTGAEAPASPAPAVVSESFARRVFGSPEAAMGRSFEGVGIELVVEGVAPDLLHFGLDAPPQPTVYLPFEQQERASSYGSLVVRVSRGAGSGTGGALRRAIWAVDDRVPVSDVATLQERLDRSTRGRRFGSAVIGAFAAVALLLAAGGVYGTLLFATGRRRRELGIRLALGASRGALERDVVRRGLVLASLGVALGLLGAWAAGRLVESQIWGVSRTDPLALGGAAAVLWSVALLASWLPARHAGRVDPLETLNAE